MTLVVRPKARTHVGVSGWSVVVEATGEVILSTQWGITRSEDEPWEVFIPWPRFKSGLRVADEAASLALAEKVYARLAERLALSVTSDGVTTVADSPTAEQPAKNAPLRDDGGGST